MQYSSLWLLTSMAVEKCHRLKQGYCKNAFCNAKLPDDKANISKPPACNPDAKKNVFWIPKKTFDGLDWSPRHWYEMVNSILAKMGLQPSLHDPCLFQGVTSSPTSPTADTDKPLHFRFYVDNFVYFSEDAAIKKRFELLLAAKLKIMFMGTVNWFLDTHFG